MTTSKYNSVILTVFLGFIVLIAYNYLVKLPEQKLINEQMQEAAAKTQYDYCTEVAYDNYITDFNLNCELQGKEAGCSLNLALANDLSDKYNADSKLCLEEYKAQK
jgi:hypothetical protein